MCLSDRMAPFENGQQVIEISSCDIADFIHIMHPVSDFLTGVRGLNVIRKLSRTEKHTETLRSYVCGDSQGFERVSVDGCFVVPFHGRGPLPRYDSVLSAKDEVETSNPPCCPGRPQSEKQFARGDTL